MQTLCFHDVHLRLLSGVNKVKGLRRELVLMS